MTPALQTVFQIGPDTWDGIDTNACRLLVDAGPRHLQFAVSQPGQHRILAVGSYSAKNGQFHDWMEEARTLPLLKMPFGKKHLFFNVPDSVLVPGELYRRTANPDLLNLVHGDLRNGRLGEDFLEDLDIHNIYRLPEGFQEQLSLVFPGAETSHLYSCLLQQLATPATAVGDRLHLFFYPHMILVLLIRKGRLQLMQSYPYELPEDVSYQLLNICEQMGLDPQSLRVTISGAIDPGSPLYAEVLKYFLEVEPATALNDIEFEDGFLDHPAHYFQPFTMLASCAS
jgi:hypothetical protein